MARRPYVPSGNSEPGGFLLLLAASTGAGLLAGVIEGVVSQWFSLLLLFPAALGIAVTAVGAGIVTSRKIRKPLAVGLAMLIAGLAAESAVHSVKYRHVRSLVAEDIASDPKAAEYIQANGMDQAVDAAFRGEDEEEDLPPFINYLKLAAKNGITITGHGKSTLTGIAVYILWLVNFLIVCGVAISGAVTQAKAPFCENCNEWYGKATVLAIGAGEKPALSALLERLETGQFTAAARELGKSDGKTAIVLMRQSCARCTNHEPVLELKHHTGLGSKKEKERDVWSSLVTPSEARALQGALEEKQERLSA